MKAEHLLRNYDRLVGVRITSRFAGVRPRLWRLRKLLQDSSAVEHACESEHRDEQKRQAGDRIVPEHLLDARHQEQSCQERHGADGDDAAESDIPG
jgi:hypothetical protein